MLFVASANFFVCNTFQHFHVLNWKGQPKSVY
uniref:Uncharacterized protein n=1 Tax=Arundo donax TaxID=35708 RepID=A0A0A8ZCT6_ARUDO